MQAFIYHLTMMRSKRYIQKTYGKSFWNQFQALSDPVFHQVSKELPDIGDSIFSFNYAYAPSYVAWYRAMQQLKLSPKEADALLWKMNEKNAADRSEAIAARSWKKLFEWIPQESRTASSTTEPAKFSRE